MRTARLGTWGYVLLILLCTTAPFAGAAGPPSDVDAAIAEIQTRIADGWYDDARDAAEALLTHTLVSYGPGALETAAAMNALSETLLLSGHPNDPRILELCRTSRDIRERLLGPEHVTVAESLAIEGRILQNLGRPSEARPVLERALAIDERALGPDHLEVAKRLMELAETTWGDEETELYERALAIRAGALGPDHPDVAVAQIRVASARQSTGADIGETTKVYERALSTIERALGPDHPEVATTLTYMVGNVSRRDSPQAAIALLERVRTIRELRLGPEHPDCAWTLYLLAGQYYRSGDVAEVESLFARSRTMLEQVFGPEHPLIGFLIAGGASILNSRLQLAEAKAEFERALGLFERAYGPEHPTVAMTLNELAIVALRSEQFTEAKALWERALFLQETYRGQGHLDVAMALNNLAYGLWNLGSYAEAEPLYLRALAIYEQQLGPDDKSVAHELRSIARLYLNMGRCAEAKPLTERALAILEKQSPSESRRVAEALSTLAFAQHCLGLYTDARRSMERALVLFENHYGPDHQVVARRLTHLAQILEDSGARDEAVALLRRAMTIVEGERAPEQSIFSAEVYSDLAGLLLVSGATEDARRLALRAEEIGRAHLERTASALSEQRALRYSAIRISTLDLLISIAAGPSAGNDMAQREAWDSLVRSRGLVLDTMASRHRTVAAAGDPETAEAARRYAAASQRLANLYVRGPGEGSSTVYDAAVADAQREKQQAEERLASLSRSFQRAQAVERAGLVEVSQGLGESDALVAYARYRRFSSSPSAGRAEPVPSYVAFVLHRGAVDVVPLGEAREIDALVAEVRNAIAREASDPGRSARRSEAAYRTAGNALRSRIWDPLAPQLAGASIVFVVPDGSLNLVAFAGLPAGRTDYLLRTGPTIHYLSAERDLASMAVPWTAGQGLLAVGGAAFDDAQVVTASASYRGSRSACGDFRSVTFDPLPATLDECEAVSSIWERVGGSALRLTGRAATEAGFKESAPGKRVVHAATHGFFLGDGCPSAVEVLGKRGGIGAMSESDPVPDGGENPLVLSGLAFAGANRRNLAGADDDDGILTAEEIGALDLAGVEWAVLSGCETGVGEVLAGEGVLGLRRAFQTAGVRTLIMSLWTVEDVSTRDWMSALYRHHLGDGLSTAESVRRASVEVLTQRKKAGLSTHPFYWAGFVAAGDWR